jgi:hypothetical protein
MAYAEKHGRGRRARWRDADGSLRSASGFGSRKAAEDYGRDREVECRVYSFTRGQLIGALGRITEIDSSDEGTALESVASTADAIIEALLAETMPDA